jgi:hypothetical protein
VNQRRVEPLKDVIPGVYEHEACPVEVHAGIITPKHVEDEVVGVGRGLDPRRSSDDDEREQIIGERAPQPFGFFEAVYDGVADPQGVPQPLEVYGVLPGTRGTKESRTALPELLIPDLLRKLPQGLRRPGERLPRFSGLPAPKYRSQAVLGRPGQEPFIAEASCGRFGSCTIGYDHQRRQAPSRRWEPMNRAA